MLLGGLFTGSCATPAPSRDAGPTVHLSSPADVRSINRVAMVRFEAADARDGPGLARALASKLRDRGLFAVTTLDPQAEKWRELPLRGRRPLSLEHMRSLRSATGADAVLLGRVHTFAPFPHLRLGLSLRLIDLRKGKLVWGLDHVWDTDDSSTVRRIRAHHRATQRSGTHGPLDWRVTTQSERALARFVAHDVAGTLPRAGSE